MKHLVLLSFLPLFFLSHFSFSQTPPPSSLSGLALRQWYKQNYYEGKHQTLGYTTARQKMYNFIDNDNNTITCVYSGYEQSWTYGGTGTNPMPINCEHTVPQSFFGKAEPMKSDIHHLFPTFSNWNSTRSNYPFREIADSQTDKWMLGSSSQSTIPSSNIDAYSEAEGQQFEPREDHKGNVARAIFYFYTMYPIQAGDISRVADVNMLYQWHLQDPVDNEELQRNDLIEQYQGDRNPYIDFPQTVALAWELAGNISPSDYCLSKGNSVSDEWIGRVTIAEIDKSSGRNAEGYSDHTSLSTTLIAGSSHNITIYPAWSGTVYNEGYAVWIDWNADGDFDDQNELVYSKSPTNLTSVSGTITTPTNIASGTTRMRVSMKYNGTPSPCETFSYGEVEDYTIILEASSDNGTNPPSGVDLFISEYIEGSSYNKAIEIYNPTPKSIDLSGYSIKKQTNGSGNWINTLALSGTLEAGQTYVIVNAAASTNLKSKADLLTSSYAIAFNGNDPVALFKNNALLDVVGTFNSTDYFASNKTLVRNPSISSPNTIYLLSEWTVFGNDNFENIGLHNLDLGNDNSSIPSNYCTSKGSSVADEWIERVSFGNIDNTSGANGGYNDFTNMSTSLAKGISQSISIYPAWASSVYNEAYNVWIDLNRDGDFEDSGELVFSQTKTTSSVVSGTITIPASASLGTTRMRVSMKYNANATPCESYSYGEVEDYHINILSSAKVANTSYSEDIIESDTKTEFVLYPNPSQDEVFLKTKSAVLVASQIINIRIFDIQGKFIEQMQVSDFENVIPIPAQRLKKGLYFVELSSKSFRQTFKMVRN